MYPARLSQVMTQTKNGVPKGSRTPVAGMKTRSPRPLDDGDFGERRAFYEGHMATSSRILKWNYTSINIRSKPWIF